jgi:hypothetical protein
VQAGKDMNMNIVWTAASLVLTRCFTVYTTAQTQRTMLQQQMTSALYDKMQDSQEGVVSVIMEVGSTRFDSGSDYQLLLVKSCQFAEARCLLRCQPGLLPCMAVASAASSSGNTGMLACSSRVHLTHQHMRFPGCMFSPAGDG